MKIELSKEDIKILLQLLEQVTVRINDAQTLIVLREKLKNAV